MRALMTCSLALMACGTTATRPPAPSPDARERGLAELRTALDLSPPLGRVADGWLVFADGTRFAAVPDDWSGKALDAAGAALFEGAPGLAFVVADETACFATTDADGVVRWSPRLDPGLTLPVGDPLLSIAVDSASEDALAPKTRPLVLAAHPGAKLVADEMGISVRDADDETLASLEIGDYECRSTVTASAWAVLRADGSTIVRFDTTPVAVDDCYMAEGPISLVYVFRPDGTSYLAQRDASGDARSITMRVYPLGAGYVYYVGSTEGAGYGESTAHMTWEYRESPESDGTVLIDQDF